MPRFRDIAPAPHRHGSSESRSSQETSSLGPLNDSRALPPRRPLSRKACVYCKTKKIKCNGGEPCFQCQSRQLPQECRYELSQEEALRVENARLQVRIQELELLCRPLYVDDSDNIHLDDIAVSVFDSGPSSGEASLGERLDNEPRSHYSQPLVQRQPSPTKSSSALGHSPLPPSSISRQASADPSKEYMLQPHAHHSLANELATRYPSVYPPLIHPDAERLGLQVIYDPSQLASHISARQATSTAEHNRPYLLSESRLERLDITQWTDVEISRDLAASLLSQYFVNDQSVFQLFDADLFLNDLAYGGHIYCSSQLVNALLAWACQAYRNLYPENGLQELGVQFLARADHLFWQSLSLSTITSAPTATLLELCAMMSGHADLSARYKAASLAASQFMGLFGTGDAFPAGSIAEPIGIPHSSSQWTKATSHTAWGVFSNQTFTDLHSRSCAFQGHPRLPIAGRDPYKLDDGSFSMLPRPSYTDVSYVPTNELAIIVHDMVQLYYYTGEPDDSSPLAALPARNSSLEQAEHIFQRLLLWASGLPLACVRGDQNSPETMFMHMHFHAAVIALFQPFIFGPLQRLKFQSFDTQGSALCAFNSSVDQLKRLVVNYQSTFNFQGNLLGPLSGIMSLASSLCQTGPSVERKDDSVRQHYFEVCIKGLIRIVGRFEVVKVYIQGLLALALSTHTSTRQQAEWVMGEVTRPENASHSIMAAEHLTSNIIADYELALTDRSAATYDKIATTLGNLSKSDKVEPTIDVDHVAEDDK
ncbi:hypothetical protein QBC41DRAFT_224268 [Cercophora samala]|uniref:Zn(2)-C6 fungal-type domain-containing protein n=1 Tax=Cercophora samala TaxID=330535 RepID=A0AA40DBT2_9PEZI|nr:hypothetical protein QBC41DRAFT_224268 [Cercophora samala]